LDFIIRLLIILLSSLHISGCSDFTFFQSQLYFNTLITISMGRG